VADVDLSALQDRVRTLELQISRERDLRAVEYVLVRYSRALDWLDDKALEQVFWDDAEIDYGFFKGSGKEFRPVLMQVERSVGRRFHFTSQVKIALTGDVAEVESYNISLACESVEASDKPILQFFGFYLDRIERREARWAIARRKHLHLAGSSIPEVAMGGPLASLNKIGETSTSHRDFRDLDRK
jgi:hypothetical protein